MPDYLICGLAVRSEVELPGVVKAVAPVESADVFIRRAAVALPFEGDVGSGLNWHVEGANLLFRVPGIVRCQVTEGRLIQFAPEGDTCAAEAVPFLLSTGFGALLHQRELLVLHASAVAFNGHAVAICGPSGVGKSTLAAALCSAGGGFVCDDMAVVRFEADGTPAITPDGRQHRLWSDAVEHLALDDRRGQAVRATLRKYHVDPGVVAVPAKVPLKAIIVLREASLGMPPGLSRLTSADAAPLLRQDIFRRTAAARMGRDVPLFFQVAALLGQVRVFRFDRRNELGAMHENVRLVLDRLEGSDDW
ncbi:hypothetical protein LZ023_32560 [Pseudomonas silvicola]|nr:hypothetical protein LZ023_32560 [Pseudomonas silvicola]